MKMPDIKSFSKKKLIRFCKKQLKAMESGFVKAGLSKEQREILTKQLREKIKSAEKALKEDKKKED